MAPTLNVPVLFVCAPILNFRSSFDRTLSSQFVKHVRTSSIWSIRQLCFIWRQSACFKVDPEKCLVKLMILRTLLRTKLIFLLTETKKVPNIAISENHATFVAVLFISGVYPNLISKAICFINHVFFSRRILVENVPDSYSG